MCLLYVGTRRGRGILLLLNVASLTRHHSVFLQSFLSSFKISIFPCLSPCIHYSPLTDRKSYVYTLCIERKEVLLKVQVPVKCNQRVEEKEPLDILQPKPTINQELLMVFESVGLSVCTCVTSSSL